MSGKTNVSLDTQLKHMTKQSWKTFCSEFRVMPTFISTEHVLSIYSNLVSGKPNDDPDKPAMLTFKDFQEGMVRICRKSGDHLWTVKKAMDEDPNFHANINQHQVGTRDSQFTVKVKSKALGAEGVSGEHLRVLIKFLDMPDNKMELKKKLVNINDYWMNVLTKSKAK
jgi:hypothetical protein